MQTWFETGACDGFSVAIDAYHGGLDAFVDQVLPLLQEQGVVPTESAGATLRDHLGVPEQYGLDPRTAVNS